MKLHYTILMVWIFLCSGCASAQAGDDKPAEAPEAKEAAEGIEATGEILLASPPSGWARVGGTRSESLQLAEYIPEAEINADPEAGEGMWKDRWKEKITLERLAGSPVPDPLDFLEGLKTDHLASCTHGSYTPISAAEENGYPTAVALLACPKLTLIDVAQVTLIKVIQGNEAFYTITRSIRGAPQTPPREKEKEKETAEADAEANKEEKDASAPSIDPTLVGGASVWLRAISVCETGSGKHPCPAEPAGQ